MTQLSSLKIHIETFLTLPGTVTPATVAHVYARAAGYVKKRYVDLEDKVHRGQLLALISAPDLDAIVLQN
jgi:multidrug efflux pump subunit AcrA (membrane-fusion protein)